MNNQAHLPAVAIFSGAGRLDLGLEQAGFQNIWAAELDSNSVSTLKRNFSKSQILRSDVTKLKLENLIELYGPHHKKTRSFTRWAALLTIQPNLVSKLEFTAHEEC